MTYPLKNECMLKIPQNLRIFVIRHGQSEANVLHVLSTDPKVNCTSCGLTQLGKQQVIAGTLNFLKEFANLLDPNNSEGVFELEIISSDFLRAKESSDIFASETERLLKNKWPNYYGDDFRVSLKYDSRFRERFYGQLDGKETKFCQDFWKNDYMNYDNHEFGAESPKQVFQRISTGIDDIITGNVGDTKKMLFCCCCLFVIVVMFSVFICVKTDFFCCGYYLFSKVH